MDDEQLVSALARLAEGDKAALRPVYAATSAKLFAICLRICGERDAAQDVLQEVYIKLINRAGGYQATAGAPMAWMARIARNSAIDWLRANRRRTNDGRSMFVAELPMDQADDSASAEQMLGSAQEAERLGQLVDGLEDDQRRHLRDAFFGGLTYAEVAARDGIPLATVKSRIRRGLMRLRQELGE